MAESLCGLRKKGSGDRGYYKTVISSTTPFTRYDIDCKFKPDYAVYKFSGSVSGNMGLMDRNQDLLSGIWYNSGQSSIYSATISSLSNIGFTDNGLFVDSDGGSMSGKLEVIAVKL